MTEQVDGHAIAGIMVRAAYRTLLGREPEAGVIYANEPSPIGRDQEIEIESILRRMLESLEFSSRLERLPEFPAETWVLAPIFDDMLMWVDLGDKGVSHPALRCSYEASETAFVDSVLQPGMHFVDIGANIGWFALRAARAVGPTGKVTAFEPRMETSRRLAMSAKVNDFEAWMAVHSVALGSEDGEMHIGYGADGINAGGTWSLPSSDMVEYWQNSGHIVQPTPVRRLDDIIGDTHVDIVKIDIEGAEMMALRGAAEVIRRDRPVILTEVNPTAIASVSRASPDDLMNYIRSFGYDGFYLEDGKLCGLIGESVEVPESGVTNVVFTPN